MYMACNRFWLLLDVHQHLNSVTHVGISKHSTHVCVRARVRVGFVMCGYSSATLTEVFPCFFLSCKANARVKLAKMGHGPHSSKLVSCVVLCIVCM